MSKIFSIIFGIIFFVISTPFIIIFRLMNNIVIDRKLKLYPLDQILEKTSLFLKPQINIMEELEGNKFGFITWESIIYITSVAETIGGRTILREESEFLFLHVLGEEYKPRINHIIQSAKNGNHDVDEFKRIMKEIQKIAQDDVQKGMFYCSNFLTENAKPISAWQKKIKMMQS